MEPQDNGKPLTPEQAMETLYTVSRRPQPDFGAEHHEIFAKCRVVLGKALEELDKLKKKAKASADDDD